MNLIKWESFRELEDVFRPVESYSPAGLRLAAKAGQEMLGMAGLDAFRRYQRKPTRRI